MQRSKAPIFPSQSQSVDVSPISSNSPGSLWSPSVQTLLDRPPSTLPHRFVLGGVLFCCIFAAWAWFGQVQEVSQAQGKLEPQGEVYKIQPATQGEVTRILVKEGDRVTAGQLIAELDSRLSMADVQRLQQALGTYQTQLIQTQALIDKARLESEMRQAIATAQTRVQTVAITEAETNARMYRELEGQLQQDLAAYETRLTRLQPLVQEGAIAADRLFDIEQSMRAQQRALTQNQGESYLASTEAHRLQAELTQKQAEGQADILAAQQRLQQLELEATQLKSQIAETETALQAAQTRMQQMFLYAPVDGIVLSLTIKNTGELAQPGQTVAEIAPTNAPLILSATLPNREAGLVEVGMPVQTKFDAFPYQDYGMVPGKVVAISPDAERHEQWGDVYRIEIALEQPPVSDSDHTISLKAGQTAQAEIITRRRRIVDVLLDPIKQLQKGGLNL